MLLTGHVPVYADTTEQLEAYLKEQDKDLLKECLYTVQLYIASIQTLRISPFSLEEYIRDGEEQAKENGYDHTTVRDFITGFYYEDTPEEVKYKLVLIELKDCIEHNTQKP